MMKPWLKTVLAATAASLIWNASEAQTVRNLIANPDLDVAGALGASTTDSAAPRPSDVIIAHESAAADWQLVARRLGDFSIQTELVPSDGVAGTRMLHVRAHGVTFVELLPDLDTPPPTPHPAFFCVWVKVVQAGYAEAQISGAGSGGVPTGAWQYFVGSRADATTNVPVLTVHADRTSSAIAGDVEFYVRSATFTLEPLTACPLRTRDSLAAGRPTLNAPPRYPAIEHPQWTAPASQGAAPYGQGSIAPAYVPGPNALPPSPSNGPAAPANAPGGKK
jgi:hypothetical protein